MAEYEQFFVAAATVAGALIGLLFVAISVRPSAAARTAHISTRVNAISALSVFLDALFVSLLALVPHVSFGSALVTLAGIGLAGMLLLLFLLVAHGRDRPWQSLRGAVFLVGGAVLYVLQLSDGVVLESRPDMSSALDHLAIILLVFFSFGVTRSWEFVGADNPSLLGTIVTTLSGQTTAAHHTSADDSDQRKERPNGHRSAPSNPVDQAGPRASER